MKAIIGFIIFLAAFFTAIILGEGMSGLRPFIMAESLLLVFLGTAIIMFFTFPLKTILESVWALFTGKPENEAKARACELFHAAANTGCVIGILVTISGIILILSSTLDINMLPIRFAFVLTALFYGLLLYVFFKALETHVKHSSAL